MTGKHNRRKERVCCGYGCSEDKHILPISDNLSWQKSGGTTKYLIPFRIDNRMRAQAIIW